MPHAVAWLGYGGLLPFVATAAAVFLDPVHALLWARILIAYGAVILSFVGALHWAFAMTLTGLSGTRQTVAFIWSVVPALLAWPALLLPYPYAAALIVAGFVLHYAQDRSLAALGLPSWYLPLRLRLTLVACAALLLSSLAPR